MSKYSCAIIQIGRFTNILITIIVLTHCSNINEIETSPQLSPSSIPQLEYFGSYFYDAQTLCILIIEGNFFERGDNAQSLHSQLILTLEIEIDGQDMSISNIYSGDGLRTRYDENNNVIGTSGSPSAACLDIPQLENGLHTIAVRASSTSGIEYSQSWKFELRQGEPSLILTPTVVIEQ
jgi:hypothetical protein